ncbi:MAG: hypothetical protein N3E48_04005 [Candidatus Bathyarchaeota archaeon]|nr:hypothetical protein [Candidatus Bathyarchaeota archaeon]
MNVRDKILNLLKDRGSEGILQGEIPKILKCSRSTTSEILAEMLRDRKVIRKNIGDKVYRIWLLDYAPFPIKKLIRVGILRATEYPHVLLTVKDLEKANINVKLKIFDNALEATNALSVGCLDVACTPLITQVLYALLLRSIKIFAGCGFNGSGLTVKNEKFLELIYGCSELSTMEMSLKLFLRTVNIDPSQVEIRYFTNPDRMVESFIDNEVSALSIWEPYLSLFRGKFKVYNFEDIFGKFPCCTLAANVRFINTNQDLFKKFLGKYCENTDNLLKRKDEAIQLTVEVLGFPYTLVNLSFERFLYDYRLGYDEIVETLKKFGIFLTKQSLNEVFEVSA